MPKVMDVIKNNTDDLGPLSLDSFRRMNLSASWRFVGQEIPSADNAKHVEVRMRDWVFLNILISIFY